MVTCVSVAPNKQSAEAALSTKLLAGHSRRAASPAPTQQLLCCTSKMKTFFVVLCLVAIASARPSNVVSSTDSRSIDLPALGHDIDALVNTLGNLLGGKRNIGDFFNVIKEILPYISTPLAAGKRSIDLPALGHDIDALVNTLGNLLGGKRNIGDFFNTIKDLLPLISDPLVSGKRNINLPALGHDIDALVNTLGNLLGGKRNIGDFFNAIGDFLFPPSTVVS